MHLHALPADIEMHDHTPCKTCDSWCVYCDWIALLVQADDNILEIA
jgi:wyosine [tRNA(Phe)-imidazoG37] synthetase (radical SAM superfamily)